MRISREGSKSSERCRKLPHVSEINWLSTAEAAKHLGITPRTLYRFIDQGDIAAFRFGRVIRLKQQDVDAFIEASKIQPGTLEHLYPEPVGPADD